MHLLRDRTSTRLLLLLVSAICLHAARRPLARDRDYDRGYRDAETDGAAAAVTHDARAPAQGPGRGRDATTPSQIGTRGWRDILMRVFSEISNDNLWVIAAGVAFYSFLSLFPAIASTISIYGLVADTATIQDQLLALGAVLPPDAREIVEGQIRAVVSAPSAALGISALVTLAFAIWSTSSAVKALMTGLTVVYDEKEKRSFIRYNLVALALTVGAILFLLVSLGTIVVLPMVFAVVGQGETVGWALGLLRWPLLGVTLIVALAALYRYAPSRTQPKWRWVSWGAVVAAVGWLAASLGFSWYVSNFASYNETYGTLGAVVILLMWFYLTAYIILIGGELNAEMEHQTARDTTDPPSRPIGRRGAYVADTVGESS